MRTSFWLHDVLAMVVSFLFMMAMANADECDTVSYPLLLSGRS